MKINANNIHTFKTGEVVDADQAPTGAALNPIFSTIVTAHNDTDSRVDSLQTQVSNVYTKSQVDDIVKNPTAYTPASPTAIAVSLGNNSVTATNVAPLENLRITGRTLTNLIGRAGNIENLADWSTTSSTIAADTTNYTIGTQGMKVTIGTGATSGGGYNYHSSFSLVAGNYYIILADVKNGNSSGGCTVDLASVSAAYTSNLLDTTKFNTVYRIWNQTINVNSTYPECWVWGSAGQYAYFDAIRVYQISKSMYDAINYGAYTTAQVAALFPYVDDIKGVFSPYIIRHADSSYSNPAEAMFFHNNGVQLHSSVDGLTTDQIYWDGKEYRKTARFKDMKLDGSLSWGYSGSATGYKEVSVPFTAPIGAGTMSKYDGKILVNNGSFGTGADSFYLNGSAIYVRISSADSGWADSYTPSPAEIQAYFNGWTMFNGTAGPNPDSPANNLYNGTGTKWWACRSDGVNRNWVNSTSTLPTSSAGNGYTPYRLVYQLSSSVDEPIVKEGQITLQSGTNYIQVGYGAVVREAKTPILYSGNGYYYINNTTVAGSNLAYRMNSLYQFYKNRRVDKSASGAADPNAYGKQHIVMAAGNYDPLAVYELTYFALDLHTLGVPPDQLSGQYSPNIAELSKSLASHVSRLGLSVDVLYKTSAQKSHSAWITPTLLNGWTKDSGYDLGYFKDEEGYVQLQGVVLTGTLDTVIFTLPPSYSPKSGKLFAALSSNGSTVTLAEIAVYTNGSVRMQSIGSTSWLSLDTVRFRVD